ncbi:MAG: hypothetical protein IT373_20665 [Polyangiaceae bacterium]|nr:hypothetical protein [Polyangiaceae bacterium]
MVSLSAVALLAVACGGGDAKGTCLKMCDKAVECAGDLAKEAGKKMGVEVPAAAIEEAKKQAGTAIEACKKGCDDAGKASSGDIKALADCIAKPCGEYMACMEKAAGAH